MPQSSPSTTAAEAKARAARLRAEREGLADLWTRLSDFCTERGWHAFIYVREDRDQFGRVGVKVDQAGGYSTSSWGNTTNEAIRMMARNLKRDGFDA